MKLIKTLVALVLCGSSALMAGEHNALTEKEKQEGWSLLFNGKDMSQWRNYQSESLNEKWVIENGTMMLTGKGGGDIITKEVYKDYELKLDWKICLNGNSGIFVRASEDGKRVYSKAIEMQILDDERHKDNKKPNHRAGSIYDMIQAPAGLANKAENWNSVRIVAKGKNMSFYLNDGLVGKVEIGSSEWTTLLNNSKFKKWEGFGLNKEGHIGLQDHGDQVWFRNIKIRRL